MPARKVYRTRRINNIFYTVECCLGVQMPTVRMYELAAWFDNESRFRKYDARCQHSEACKWWSAGVRFDSVERRLRRASRERQRRAKRNSASIRSILFIMRTFASLNIIQDELEFTVIRSRFSRCWQQKLALPGERAKIIFLSKTWFFA